MAELDPAYLGVYVRPELGQSGGQSGEVPGLLPGGYVDVLGRWVGNVFAFCGYPGFGRPPANVHRIHFVADYHGRYAGEVSGGGAKGQGLARLAGAAGG